MQGGFINQGGNNGLDGQALLPIYLACKEGLVNDGRSLIVANI